MCKVIKKHTPGVSNACFPRLIVPQFEPEAVNKPLPIQLPPKWMIQIISLGDQILSSQRGVWDTLYFPLTELLWVRANQSNKPHLKKLYLAAASSIQRELGTLARDCQLINFPDYKLSHIENG